MSVAVDSDGGTGQMKVTMSTPVIGAEVAGLDLRRPLTPDQYDELGRLLVRHEVLFFRDQNLDAGQQMALARGFGTILFFPTLTNNIEAFPGLQIIIPRKPTRRPDGARSSGHWHIDASGVIVAPTTSVVRAVNVPPLGGDDIWASMTAAYDGLSDELKSRIEGLYSTHDFTEQRRKRGVDYPLISLPLVRTHPVSGKKILCLQLFDTPQILGLPLDESEQLVRVLSEELTRPEYQVRFRWGQGDVAICDNRSVHQYSVFDYGDFPRRMERFLVADSEQPLDEWGIGRR